MAIAVALEQWATLTWRFTRNKSSILGIKLYISTFRHSLRKPSENWNEDNHNNDNNFLGSGNEDDHNNDNNFLGSGRVRNEPEVFGRVLNEFANMKPFIQGKMADAHIINTRMEFDIFVANNLVNMYAKCQHIEDAHRVFVEMPQRDVVSWNAMIAGYVKHGSLNVACKLFDEMPQRDVVSWNSMIAGYATHGSMNVARKLFDEMPQRDTLSWNTLLAGYTQSGDDEKALEVFCHMGKTDVNVVRDRATFASILKVCTNLEALEQGMQIHNAIVKLGFDCDFFIGSSLLDMYAKSAKLRDARQVFDKMPERNVVVWNTMIAGYAQNFCGQEAYIILVEMLRKGVTFSQSTFASILKACASDATLEEGMQDMPKAGMVWGP